MPNTHTLRLWLGLVRDFFKNLLISLTPQAGHGSSGEAVKSGPAKLQASVAAAFAQKEKLRGKFCHMKLAHMDGRYPFAAIIIAQAGATLLYSRKLSTSRYQGRMFHAPCLG